MLHRLLKSLIGRSNKLANLFDYRKKNIKSIGFLDSSAISFSNTSKLRESFSFSGKVREDGMMGNNGSWCWSKSQDSFAVPDLSAQNTKFPEQTELAQQTIQLSDHSIDKDNENKVRIVNF